MRVVDANKRKADMVRLEPGLLSRNKLLLKLRTVMTKKRLKTSGKAKAVNEKRTKVKAKAVDPWKK